MYIFQILFGIEQFPFRKLLPINQKVKIVITTIKAIKMFKPYPGYHIM